MVSENPDNPVLMSNLWRLIRAPWMGPASKPCACGTCDGCTGRAQHTEHSPYMDDFCDVCTWTRCDLPT